MKRPLLGIVALLVAPALGQGDGARPEWWTEQRQQRPAAPCWDLACTIDGALDEWDSLPYLPLGLNHQTGFDRAWRGRSDLSATVRLAADEGGLLVAVEVRDDKLYVPAGDRRLGDHLALFCGAAVDQAPAAARHLTVLPAQGVAPAEVVDGDREEPVPGATAAFVATDRGWRVEARLPWVLLPGGRPALGEQRALAVRVVDWDDAKGARASLRWPSSIDPPLPAPAGPTTWQPPEVVLDRPDELGALTRLPAFDPTEAGPYLPALMPIGVERSYYDGGEQVTVVALGGLGAALAGELDVYAVDDAGRVERLTRGTVWNDGLFDGASWTWRTPLTFPSARLVVAEAMRPELAGRRVYARIDSVGDAYAKHLKRLDALRAEMLAAATAPGAGPALRRYLGAVMVNLEDAQQYQSGWRSWMARDDVARLAADITELERLFAVARSGRDPYAGKKGTYLRGYVSEIDDTVQHYSVSIPETWTPAARLPLVISLHGYGFGRFHGHPAPAYTDSVSVACYGRGNGDYKLWCERDIITVLEAMIEDYRIDVDRVYVTGGSMGGTGSWQVATMYPDRFAAIGPTAGNANHHVWEEVWGWGQRGRTFMSPFRIWLENTTDAHQYAENLRHVGVYCLHGTLDNICPVGHARTMTERLKNLGYDSVYEEFPTVGHGGFPGAAAARQRAFMFARARDPYPRQVTYKTSWHRYSGAYWAFIERFREQARDALIDARIEGQRIVVKTSNVARLRLQLDRHLVNPDRLVVVRVDGLPAFEGLLPADGTLRLGYRDGLWAPAERPAGLEKNVQVGGPVEHAFMSRFLLVRGTTGDRRTNEVNRRMTEQLAEKWRRWGRDQPARVKLDWEVTEQDVAESNLICFGGPDSNRIVAQVNDRLPIRFGEGCVTFGEQVYRGDDVGVKLCYPNPLNPSRYLCVFGGVTWQGTYDVNGRFGNWFDWGIFDDRNWYDFAVFDARTQSPETFLAVGYYDEDWSLREARVFHGDPALRRATRPRRPPDPLAGVPDRPEVYLSELTPVRVAMEKGVPGYGHSFAGNPIRLGDMTFEEGLGVHPQAELVYAIGGGFERFEAWVGVDLEGAETVSKAREEAERVAFQVYGDGRLLADTGEMRWNTRPKHLVADVQGVRELTLMARALDGRKWLFGDASWGVARLSRRVAKGDGAARPGVLKNRLDLSGLWGLDDYEVGEGVARGAEGSLPAAGAARPALLPGGVAEALVAAGELPDPYRNDQITRLAALAKREWWLYREVDLPADWRDRRLMLRLDGVTQHGEVWVNGTYAGKVGGPFEAGELDVAAAARPGRRNLLAVRLLAGPAPWTNVRSYAVPAREQVVGWGVGYGSDGGGQAIPLGVHGPIELRATGPVRLGPPRVECRPTAGAARGAEARVPARVEVRVPLTNAGETACTVRVEARLEAADGRDEPVELSEAVALGPGESKTVRLTAGEASWRLWWPAGLGERPLYRAGVVVTVDGLVSDAAETVVGVRTVRVPDDARVATVAVNGEPLVLRIAEWRPTDRLLRFDPARVERVLRLALETGFNTIRVAADSGLERQPFYDLCDTLGLLVIQDLPLTGNLAAPPLDAVQAAVDGVVTATGNHPAVVAYVEGHDLNVAASEPRRAAVDRRLADQTSHLLVEPTRSGGGEAVWRWLAVGADPYRRESHDLRLRQITLPTAPPAELDFLDRESLARNDWLTPWPLTDWWRLRGGTPADLDRAAAWAGSADGEAEMLRLLSSWQAEVARREAVEAVLAGGALCLSCLNESWPRVGPAVIDHAGRPRPARSVLRRFLTEPAAFARPSRQVLATGDTLRAAVYAETSAGDGWWARRPADWTTVRCRVQDLAGRRLAEFEGRLDDSAATGQPVGELVWAVDETVPEGTYLLVTELPGGRVGPDVVALGVTHRAGGAPLKVVWLSAAEPPAGVTAEPTDRLASPAAPECVYLGPGGPELSVTEQETIIGWVAAGAGLVMDGPPDLIAGGALEALLPATPLAGPLGLVPEPAAPVYPARDHPALLGLAGRLPDGPPSDYAQLAEGAVTLAEFGPQRPLLVESGSGKGRVLLLATVPEYARRLAWWDGRERFVTGLLAYAAKLPYGDVRRLLDRPATAPLSRLRELPAAPLKVTLTTAPLTPRPDRPEVREVRVRNEGATPVILLTLRLDGLPAGVDATFGQDAFALLPGEERVSILTVRTDRRGKLTGKARLSASGWGAATRVVELPVDAGG